MGIVRNPCCSLACVTGADEGVRYGVALAQIGVVSTAWSRVRVSRLEGIDDKRCKKDGSAR